MISFHSTRAHPSVPAGKGLRATPGHHRILKIRPSISVIKKFAAVARTRLSTTLLSQEILLRCRASLRERVSSKTLRIGGTNRPSRRASSNPSMANAAPSRHSPLLRKINDVLNKHLIHDLFIPKQIFKTKYCHAADWYQMDTKLLGERPVSFFQLGFGEIKIIFINLQDMVFVLFNFLFDLLDFLLLPVLVPRPPILAIPVLLLLSHFGSGKLLLISWIWIIAPADGFSVMVVSLLVLLTKCR